MAMWVCILFQPVRAATPVAESGDIQRIVSQAKASAAAGDFEQAWQAYSVALQKNAAEFNPLPELLVERALVRIEMGDFTGAALDCIVQLDAEPHSPRAMGVLGLVRFLQGNDEQAHLDLKAADDADGAVGREMVGRAKAIAARLEALHKLDRSRPKPVVDALVNVWKGQSKAKDGSQMEQEFRVDSRGIYQHTIWLRDEGKIETRDGTISFVSKGGNQW